MTWYYVWFLLSVGTATGWILCDFLKVQPLKCYAKVLLDAWKVEKRKNETCRN